MKPATIIRGADAVHVPAVVQRQVFQNATGKFYSDVDPQTTFDTYQEAEDYEVNMPAPDPTKGAHTERAPTLFTYVLTPTHNQISGLSIPQGPHTMGHAAVSTALFAANIALGALSSEQVPPPHVWRDQVIRECGANVFDPQTVIPEELRRHYRTDRGGIPSSEEIVARFLRAYRVYNGLWQELRRIAAGQSTEDPRDIIDELIQLGAYSVYGYDAPGKVGRAELKTKGENRDLTDPKNIDRLAKFRNRADYEEMIESRLLLLDPDYNPTLDESMAGDISESAEVDEPAVEPGATLMIVAGRYLGESSGPPSSSTRSKPGRLSMIVHHEKILVDNHPMLYFPEEVSSDGDCFFNSVINLGYGVDVKTLRQIAQQNGGQENITTEKAWAGEQDIAAIAKYFKIRIRKIVVGLDGTIIQDTTAGDAGPVVPIAHIYGGHFTPLRGPQLGASPAPAPKASAPTITSTGEKPSEEPRARTRKRNPSRESEKQPKKKKKNQK